MLIRCKKAQSTLEYALLIGVVVGALLYMQNYVKRSLQGRLKDVSDQIGDQYSPGNTHRVETRMVRQDSIEEQITGGSNGTTTTITSGGREENTSLVELKTPDAERWEGGEE